MTNRKEDVESMLVEFASLGVFLSPYLTKEALASVRLDRDERAQTYSLDSPREPEKVTE